MELAATIGKTLLDKNQRLEIKIEDLEYQLEKTSQMVNQLNHDLNLKHEILHNFIELDDMCAHDRKNKDKYN